MDITEGKFTDADKTKVVEFLNMVALNAEFKFNTKQIIEYFKLLNFMQTTILKKISDNTFEIIAVHKPEETKAKGKAK